MKKYRELGTHFDGFGLHVYNLFTEIDLLTEFAP